MSQEEKLHSLFEALADSVENLSDEELLAEVHDDGQNSDDITQQMRMVVRNTVKIFKQRALIAAKEQHQREEAHLAAAAFTLPATSAERWELLRQIIAQQQQAGRMVIAQNRDFKEMTDDDVESWLQQFGALGLMVDSEPESDE